MLHVILDPSSRSGQLVDTATLAGHDLTGKTVIDVPDNFTWVGKTPDWSTMTVVDDIAGLRARKREAVKALRSTKESATCETPSGTVQIDDSSKIKINGLATMATIAKANALPFSVGFILADNSVATLDADGAIGMSMAVGTYVSALYANSVALFAQIDGAADLAALDAIDITAGWP